MFKIIHGNFHMIPCIIWLIFKGEIFTNLGIPGFLRGKFHKSSYIDCGYGIPEVTRS